MRALARRYRFQNSLARLAEIASKDPIRAEATGLQRGQTALRSSDTNPWESWAQSEP